MSDGRRMSALVLAGSRTLDDPVAKSGGKSRKAFVEVAGRSLLARVLDALFESGRIGDVLVSLEADAPIETEAPDAAQALREGKFRLCAPARTPCESVIGALESLPADEPVLVTTADHALLTAELVATFVDAAREGGTDVAVGLASAPLVQARYPKTRRTTLKFRGGGYSSCNLFALLTPAARRAPALWRDFEGQRKKPWRIAWKIGSGMLLGYLTGTLTLDRAFDRLGRLAGARARGIILPWPEAAIDVDTVEDLSLVRRILEGGG